MLSKCVWSRCQISTTKIRQHFALFSWRKSDGASPQMHHSTQNAILTKPSTWEYENRDAPFSRLKSSSVSCSVHYGASAVFRICVHNAYRHARTVMSRSPSKHQACWCMSHTRGNQCHLVTWSKTSRYKYRYTYIMHNAKRTITHIQADIHIHIYTYAQCNHTEQKVNQTLPTFQGYGP